MQVCKSPQNMHNIGYLLVFALSCDQNVSLSFQQFKTWKRCERFKPLATNNYCCQELTHAVAIV